MKKQEGCLVMDNDRRSAIHDLLSAHKDAMDAHFWGTKVDPWLLTTASFEEQREAWEEVVNWIDTNGSDQISKGHSYFRLGVLHLTYDPTEHTGRDYLEKAYKEDKTFAPAEGKLPQVKSAPSSFTYPTSLASCK